MIITDEEFCPACHGTLKYYDKVPRIVRAERRNTRWVKVKRFRCIRCGRLHRELPVYIFPYKQYDAGVIRGVLKGAITCESLDYEDYPCEMTMARWRAQNLHLLL